MTNARFNGCPTAFAYVRGGEAKVWQKGDVAARAGDYANRLVARELLEFTCSPTSLSFVPTVTAPTGKPKVMLRVRLETHDPNYSEPRIRTINIVANTKSGTGNTAHQIADDLFLVSGFDLMRQRAVRNFFQYTPRKDAGSPELAAGEAIVLTGNPSNAAADPAMYRVIPMPIELVFELIPAVELPADTVDFTALQWGSEQTVHSCAAIFNTGI